jgi:hypothetical protein
MSARSADSLFDVDVFDTVSVDERPANGGGHAGPSRKASSLSASLAFAAQSGAEQRTTPDLEQVRTNENRQRELLHDLRQVTYACYQICVAVQQQKVIKFLF